MLKKIKIWWRCAWDGHALKADLTQPTKIIYRCVRKGCRKEYHVRG